MYTRIESVLVWNEPIHELFDMQHGVYYHISNAMQYSNTALETTALVMYDPNTLFYVGPLLIMALRFS